MQVTLRKSNLEVTDALAELGLNNDLITEAILEGEADRNRCTPHHPPCLPGIVAWGGTVRALRDLLVPKGWKKDDKGNFPTVISPDEKIAVAVATGDDGTGKEGVTPKTKYPKGLAAEAAISRNLNSLFPDIRAAAEAEKEKLDDRQTWILLKRREKDTVHAELSLPASMTKDEQVKDWLIRIILKPIITEPNVEVQDDTVDVPIDVPVRRRS